MNTTSFKDKKVSMWISLMFTDGDKCTFYT